MSDSRTSSATLRRSSAEEAGAAAGQTNVDTSIGAQTAEPTIAPAQQSAPRTITVPDLPWRRLGGFALFGVAGLIVLFLLYLLAFTPLTAARDQKRLADSLKGHPLTVYKLVNGRLPPQGSAVAVVQIPSIGVDKVVVQGTSAANLMNGPGLMPGTSLPGSPGNSVIAGRRMTFGGPFGAIGSLKPNAKIRVVDGAGAFTYKVTSINHVAIGQKDVVLPTRDNRLTLVTSDSSVVTGGREVVRAKLVGRAVAVPDSTVSVPSYDLGLSGDPAAGGLAAMWSFLTLAVLVGAAYAAWRLRRPWLVYLFSVPVVLMCGLFACQSVARALPATF
ncbi:MAG: sortase [Acidimicrobiales bacterium]